MKLIKKVFFLMFFIVPVVINAQTKGIIIDQDSKTPISFANIWIENEDVGTTSDETGHFCFNSNLINKFLIVSSVGYESKKILLTSAESKIELTPKVYSLKEVRISYLKDKKNIEFGAFKKSKIYSFYNSGGKPWIAAHFFRYNEEYENTPFIKSFELITMSESDSSFFRLRVMSVGDDGKPNNDLISDQIIVPVKKGRMFTKIDMKKYQFKFPKQGFFVAVEWLITNKNESSIERVDKKTGKKFLFKQFNPAIGNIIEKDSTNGWIYIYGSWRRPMQIKAKIKDYYGKYRNIATKVTLTD